MIKKIWKCLLNHNFYEAHKDTIPTATFDELGQQLLPTLEYAHKVAAADVNEDELLLLHYSLHPTITTAAKNALEAYIENVKNTAAVSSAVAEILYSSLWRREVGRVVAEYGIRLEQDEHSDVSELASYISKIGSSLIPKDTDVPVDTDPVAMFSALQDVGKWHLSLPTLSSKIGKVSPGMFIVLLGRSDSGKSAMAIDMVASKDGFAAQGAKVSYIANEEAALRSGSRMAACWNQISIHEAAKNPTILKTAGWDAVRKNITLVHKPDMTIGQLEAYVKVQKPDVLILDQIDHIQLSKSYENGHERLGVLYRRVRELCSMYNMVVIAVTQASAEAEGKTIVTYSMAEGSKTSKAATADAIIGLGKTDTEEGDVVTRYLHISKNKISGSKGTVVAKFIQSESRFII